MTNQQIIEQFYTAFAQANATAMVSHYHPAIKFTDPAFGTLHGQRACMMWKMLIERSKGNIEITFSDCIANETTGSCNWTAVYFFGKQKRKVVNKIHAEFEFDHGKMIKHTDSFSVKRWSKQAIGLMGVLFGGTTWFKTKLQAQSNKLLDAYLAKNEL